MKKPLLLTLLALAGCTAVPSELTLTEGEAWTSRKVYSDFEITGEARTGDGAQAIFRFCRADGHEGYGVALRNGAIALEINPRYRIPSFDIIRQARERGIKFTFGTNNVDSRFGRLEYALEAVEACGLTPGDIWLPSMSIRSSRPVVIYNHFD